MVHALCEQVGVDLAILDFLQCRNACWYYAMLENAMPAVHATAIVAPEAKSVDVANVAMYGHRPVVAHHWANECHGLQQQLSMVLEQMHGCDGTKSDKCQWSACEHTRKQHGWTHAVKHTKVDT